MVFALSRGMMDRIDPKGAAIAMHLDVLDLRNFYYRTATGSGGAAGDPGTGGASCWPPLAGQTVAGFGFAVPLLRPYLPFAGGWSA